jgi:hypothetical protein
MVLNSNEMLDRRFFMSPYLLPSVVAAACFVSCGFSRGLVAQSPEQNTFRMERHAKAVFDQKGESDEHDRDRGVREKAAGAGRSNACNCGFNAR